MTARLLVVALLAALGACGADGQRGRPARLVSPDVANDLAVQRAEREADDGDLGAAARLLGAVIARAPGDPMAQLARVRLARLRVAEGELDAATRLLGDVSASVDPALTMRRDLVRGLVFARRGDTSAGLASLRPLARRLIDRAESAEADCAVSALEARAGNHGAAILAVARVESMAESGVRWLPTGLACDRASTRADAFHDLLEHLDAPRVLADTLDALPAGHALRVDAARRLRAIAEARNELPRWLRWLADLPDTEATLRVVRSSEGPPVLRVGVLAPTVGARAAVGTGVLRAVQIALQQERAVQVDIEDEGATAAEAVAAFDRLAALRPEVVIGPCLEEHAGAVTARALERGVAVALLAPHTDDERATGPGVTLAGPPPGLRAAVLAGAVHARGRRARWTAAPGAERDLFASRVRESFARAGVTVAEPVNLAPAELHVVIGPWGIEQRARMAALAAAAPGRWVFDARVGPAGSPGVWVGLVARDEAALGALRARYCELTGAAPDELALLAWDAARAAAVRMRGGSHEGLFARPWVLRADATSTGDGALAATARCPLTP